MLFSHSINVLVANIVIKKRKTSFRKDYIHYENNLIWAKKRNSPSIIRQKFLQINEVRLQDLRENKVTKAIWESYIYPLPSDKMSIYIDVELYFWFAQRYRWAEMLVTDTHTDENIGNVYKRVFVVAKKEIL